MPKLRLCQDCGTSALPTDLKRGRCPSCFAGFSARAQHPRNTSARTAAHSAFINTTAWRKVSREVRERDGRCRRCGTYTDLTAHHIIPARVAPQLALKESNCVTLCRSCHATFESRRGRS